MNKFGDTIKFSKPTRKNEPLMFFSSNLSAEDIADQLTSKKLPSFYGKNLKLHHLDMKISTVMLTI